MGYYIGSAIKRLFFQLVLISWMITLSACLIWQIFSCILLPNEYGCLRWEILRHYFCRFWQKNIFSDEAHFDLGGYVNKQNYHIWGTENYIERPTHPKRVIVWCGFCSRGIIGPFCFENEQREAVKVNGARYRATLNEFLFTKIEDTTFGFNRATLRATQTSLLSGHVERIFVHKNWRGGYWQHLVSTGCFYVPHSQSFTRCFAPCFWRSHYQPQSWCRLATSELDRWTICVVLWKISVTQTSQRQLTL